MIVNKSLSRGLADRAFDVFDQLSKRWVGTLKGFQKPMRAGREGVRQFVEEWLALGRQENLTLLVGNHRKWRYAVVVPITPAIAKYEIEGIIRRAVLFTASALHCSSERGSVASELHMVLAVQEHAVERLFQRLNSMSVEVIDNEIHDALCMALPVREAAISLELQQIVLPTQSGAFRCSIGGDPVCLFANTWIPRGEVGSVYDEVADAMQAAYLEMGGKEGIAAACASLPNGGSLEEIDWGSPMVTCLKRFPILMKEYVRKSDPADEVWKRAREQAKSDEA